MLWRRAQSPAPTSAMSQSCDARDTGERDEVVSGGHDDGAGVVIDPEHGEVQDALLVSPDRQRTPSTIHLELAGAQHQSQLQHQETQAGAELHGPDHGELSELYTPWS